MVQGLKPLLTLYQVGPAFLISTGGDAELLAIESPDELLETIRGLIKYGPGVVQVVGGQPRPTSDYPTPTFEPEASVPPQQSQGPLLREERTEVLEGPGGRERRFKVGYDENPIPAPPQGRPEIPSVNDPRIRGQIHNIQQLSAAYLRGQYKGQPFTRKDWVEGVQQWAPDVPFPMAEQVLSEFIADKREDREGI